MCIGGHIQADMPAYLSMLYVSAYKILSLHIYVAYIDIHILCISKHRQLLY